MKASEVLDNLKRRFPNEPEYHQAVSEVLGTIEEAYNEHPEFEKSNLIERATKRCRDQTPQQPALEYRHGPAHHRITPSQPSRCLHRQKEFRQNDARG